MTKGQVIASDNQRFRLSKRLRKSARYKIHNLIYGADIRVSVRMARESVASQVVVEPFSLSILAKLR